VTMSARLPDTAEMRAVVLRAQTPSDREGAYDFIYKHYKSGPRTRSNSLLADRQSIISGGPDASIRAILSAAPGAWLAESLLLFVVGDMYTQLSASAGPPPHATYTMTVYNTAPPDKPGVHWVLAVDVVCAEGTSTTYLFDPMRPACKHMRIRHMSEQHRGVDAGAWRALSSLVPLTAMMQQDNGFDCGVLVCLAAVATTVFAMRARGADADALFATLPILDGSRRCVAAGALTYRKHLAISYMQSKYIADPEWPALPSDGAIVCDSDGAISVGDSDSE
jgi:hypothetical protein